MPWEWEGSEKKTTLNKNENLALFEKTGKNKTMITLTIDGISMYLR